MAQTAFLFVYGTLRRSSGHPMAEFLAQKARFVGQGKTRGRRVGHGAASGVGRGGDGGLIEAENAEDWVDGDVFELREPAQTLAALDRYEGSGFARTTATVVLDDDAEISAWLYRYRG